jgi:hypothetical protein
LQIILADQADFVSGDVLYPFSFLPPDDLQHNFVFASRRVQDSQGVRVIVHYEVEATRTVAQSTVQANALSRIHPIPIAVPFGRRVDAMREEAIKLMGLFSRGTCSVALSVAMDVLDPSSTIQARVVLGLQTTQALKYVSLALHEKAAVDRHDQSLPGKTIGTRQVCCRRLDKAAINLPPNGTAGSTELTIQLPLSPNETLVRIRSTRP